MATEPVARSRVVENEEVFDGYALERSCEGEQDEDFRAQTQHLLEQVYEAIELLEWRWAKLCEHANYDRRKGQPVVVTTKDGKRRLPPLHSAHKSKRTLSAHWRVGHGSKWGHPTRSRWPGGVRTHL